MDSRARHGISFKSTGCWFLFIFLFAIQNLKKYFLNFFNDDYITVRGTCLLLRTDTHTRTHTHTYDINIYLFIGRTAIVSVYGIWYMVQVIQRQIY